MGKSWAQQNHEDAVEMASAIHKQIVGDWVFRDGPPWLVGYLEDALKASREEAIEEAARRCAAHASVEGIAQACERDILAMLQEEP